MECVIKDIKNTTQKKYMDYGKNPGSPDNDFLFMYSVARWGCSHTDFRQHPLTLIMEILYQVFMAVLIQSVITQELFCKVTLKSKNTK